MENIISPKVFMSYSWKPAHNKERVKVLAERLQLDGIHVIIDIWDLKEGHDKYSFMEQMVTSGDIDKVLIICNQDYTNKSNRRDGGVGVESTIMSSEIYEKADQTKFIPIIFERDNEGKEFVPTFVKSRIYIDLSNDERFEDNYESLLRNIYNKPLVARPALGTMPSYLKDEKIVFLPTAHKVNSIRNAYIAEKKYVNVLIEDYLQLVIQTYTDSAEFETTNNNDDEVVMENLDGLKALRDDFIDFLDIVLNYGVDFEFSRFNDFWAKVVLMKLKLKGEQQPRQTDHVFIALHELFLYFLAMLLRKEKFNQIVSLLTDPIIQSQNNYIQVQSCLVLYHYSKILVDRNTRLNLNRINLTFDLLIQRANNKFISFDELREADILLNYITKLNEGVKEINKGLFNYWFPITSVRDSYGSLPIMVKAAKVSFFNKIKVLFGVDTKEELESKCEAVKPDNVDFNYSIPNLSEGLNLSNIGRFR